MRSALVFNLVTIIFVVAYSLPELCVFNYYEGNGASCGKYDVTFSFDFIPPVSRKISFLTMHGQPLKQLPYNAFRNLSSQSTISVIVLQHCQLSHVDASALLNLHNLTTIDLSCNDIYHVDSKLFSHTKQMKLIDMGHNKIETFSNGLFQNLLMLEIVYLEHNQIHHVENYSFKNTPSLRKIALHNNQIEFMNMLFKDKFDNLKALYLHDNPWKCDCELGPLYEFLVEIDHLNQPGLGCEKPPTLQGRNWSDISTDEFVCRTEDATSTQNSVMTSTEPMTTDGTTPQPPSDQNWILYIIILAVMVMCNAAVIIGIVLLKRGSCRQTNSSDMDSGLPIRVVQSSAVSSNMADVGEESRSIFHSEMREATIN